MIIPIGHDMTIRRIPYVTVGIMVVCVAVQAWISAKAPSDAELAAIAAEEEGLLRAAWSSEQGRRYLEERVPNLHVQPMTGTDMARRMQRIRFVHVEFNRDFRAGRVGGARDPLNREWRRLQERKSAVLKVLELGYRPQNNTYTLVTHTFVHGGWLHLIGNMLFLWLCGCNMEDRWGAFWWVALYVVGGAVSAEAFAMVHRWEVRVPLIGASGAIAAAMGAFLVVCWDATMRFFYFLWYRIRPVTGTFEMKTYWALPIWFVQQLLGSMVEGPFVPVAYSAHVGGFVFGVAAALLMKATGMDQRMIDAEEEKSTVFSQSPLFLEAVAARDAGDLTQARERLEQLLEQDPNHTDAAIELFTIELRGEDGATAARLASRAILLCARDDDAAGLRQVFRDVRERFPQHPVDARALFAVGESYQRDDPGQALEAYQQLARCFPHDPIVPKALLRAAELYAESFREPLTAQRVLHQVRQHFPGTPFAERAEAMLRQLGRAQ